MLNNHLTLPGAWLGPELCCIVYNDLYECKYDRLPDWKTSKKYPKLCGTLLFKESPLYIRPKGLGFNFLISTQKLHEQNHFGLILS